MLANIYLHWFDKVFHRTDGPGQWAKARLVRYADDFVVLAKYRWTRYRVSSKRNWNSGWDWNSIGRKRGSSISGQWGPNLGFLGYTFRYDRDPHGRRDRYLNVFPSKEAVTKGRARLRELTSSRFASSLLLH